MVSEGEPSRPQLSEGWSLEVSETSLGAYRVIAKHLQGPSVETTDGDLREAYEYVQRRCLDIDEQLRAKRIG